MIAAVSLLLAFPLGFFFRSRLTAGVIFGFAWMWAFTYQSVYLLVDTLGGSKVFIPGEFPWAYGVISLAIGLVGVGLLALGHLLGTKRRNKAALSV